uniref:Uncharacterized protein n=1 Tax=Mycena chlorophos TaxID=658473 RepID=A0ABQ0MDM4_MYCCL|nr:predicted protein [Mycena chlorophos]
MGPLFPPPDDPSGYHLGTLAHFDLHKLESVTIIAPLQYYLPFKQDPPPKVTSLELPELRTVVAPLQIVYALVRATTNLTSVAVQGTLVARDQAFCLVRDLHAWGHPLKSLALDLVAWDGTVIPYICQQLPGLESLEVVYHQYPPRQASLWSNAVASDDPPSSTGGNSPTKRPSPRKLYFETLGTSHLPELAHLTTLRIHPFPLETYNQYPWIAPGSNRNTIAPTPSTPASRLADVESVSRMSPSLLRARLRHDRSPARGWARADARSCWQEIDSEGWEDDEIACTSTPAPGEYMNWGPAVPYVAMA